MDLPRCMDEMFRWYALREQTVEAALHMGSDSEIMIA